MDELNAITAAIQIPLWHPYLRTAAVLRLSREHAQALVTLTEALAALEPPRTATLRECIRLAVRDLYQCFLELEFLEPGGDASVPETERSLHRTLLKVRPRLETLTSLLNRWARLDLRLEDSTNPVRAAVERRMPTAVAEALGGIASQAARNMAHCAEVRPLVDDVTWAAAAGVICDGLLIAGELREAATVSAEATRILARVAGALEGEARKVLYVLPARQPDERCLVETDVEVPVLVELPR